MLHLFLAVHLISIVIAVCNAVKINTLPAELWHRTLTFVDMEHPQSANLPLLNRRTYQFYEPDYTAISRLESIIYAIKDVNAIVDYKLVWNLSKQVQLSSVPVIETRYHETCMFVDQLSGRSLKVYFVNPKARHLMHALGCRSINMHEYNAMTLDDDNINITESGKQKLRLLLLASKASQPFQTAVLDLSGEQEQAEHNDVDAVISNYMQIESMRNSPGFMIWIWSNFPWLASPERCFFHTHSHLLYFDCLYEFLWSRYHHEFGFPPFESRRYISDFDDKELLKKREFVQYLMDKYRFRIHRQFNVTKREMVDWFEMTSAYPSTEHEDTWKNLRFATMDLFWNIAQAERLNELLMPDNPTLSNEFMTTYILSIIDEGVFDINAHLPYDGIPFVERVIARLVYFNYKENTDDAYRLKELLQAMLYRF